MKKLWNKTKHFLYGAALFTAPVLLARCAPEEVPTPDPDPDDTTNVINPGDTTTNPGDTTTTVQWDTVAIEQPGLIGLMRYVQSEEDPNQLRIVGIPNDGDERNFFFPANFVEDGNARLTMSMTYDVGFNIDQIMNSFLPNETADLRVNHVSFTLTADEGEVIGYVKDAPIAISEYRANSILTDHSGYTRDVAALSHSDTLDYWDIASLTGFIAHKMKYGVAPLPGEDVTITYTDADGNQSDVSWDDFVDANNEDVPFVPRDEEEAGTYEVSFATNVETMLWDRGSVIIEGQEYEISNTPYVPQ